MKRRIWALVAGALAAMASPALALDPASELQHYVERVWTVEEGLPAAPNGRMAQTPEGYLWLGSVGGLVRFNGTEFRLFDGSTTPALGQNLVWELAVGPDGTLWIGSFGSGAARWRAGAFEKVAPGELEAGIVKTFLTEPDGGAWISTERSGLVHVAGPSVRRFTTRDGLTSDYTDNLQRTPDGAIWFRTDRGISRLAAGRLDHFDESDGVPRGVEVLLVDRSGRLWAGGYGAVCALAGERFACTGVPSGALVTELLDDAAGDLWIASRRGLARWARGELHEFGASEGVPEVTIFDLATDRDGNVWVASEAGLHRWDGERFASRTFGANRADQPVGLLEDRDDTLWVATSRALHALFDGRAATWGAGDGLLGRDALTVAEGSPGEVWIGTPDGLDRLRGGRLAGFTTVHGLPHGTVRAVLSTRAGEIWVGTGSGLCRFSAERCWPLAAQGDLPSPAIRALFEDRAGALWIGTEKGLARWADGRVRRWTAADGLANPVVRAFYEDGSGALWFGTDGGLHRLRGETIDVVTAAHGLRSEVVRCLAGDGRDGFWIGLLGGGLHHWRDGEIFAFGDRSGLPSSSIFALQDDGLGHLWAATDKGIARLDLAELAAVEQGRLERLAPLVLGRADGLASEDCSGASQPAALRDDAGRLWFRCAGGAVAVDPARLEPRREPPPVLLEEVVVDERPLDPRRAAELPPGTARIELRYASPTARARETARFRYRLDGFDRDWVAAGSDLRAAYTRLAPGRYTFRVAASYPESRWSEPAAWAFAVEPFFYQTSWFLALCGLGMLSAVLAVCELRARSVRARYAAVLDERARIAREAHDSLAQGLTAISLQLESVEETMTEAPEEAGKHLDLARALVRSSLSEARRLVSGLRPESLDHQELAAALEEIGRQLTADSPTSFNLRSDGRARTLPEGIEQALFRIGQEAITNAVRHARARRVEVELAFSRRDVRLTVGDDGVGFDPAAQHAGFGLLGLRERAQELGGRMEIESRPGHGTTLSFVVRA